MPCIIESMISFVWSSQYPLMAGTGGSENYTIGHVRELLRRGLKAKIITVGLGENDGRQEFPDVPFIDVSEPKDLADLDTTIIFITEPLNIKTKRKSYAILHCPPGDSQTNRLMFAKRMKDKQPIVTSHHAAKVWSEVLGIPAGDIPIVYPFASEEFKLPKPRKGKKIRVLFAGRLTPDKGIYTLLWAAHSSQITPDKFIISVTNAGGHTPEGKIIHKLVKAHPNINVLRAKKTPQAMAELLANTDIVVMPSSVSWWDEMFGILSIEAQHAGCRVVGSNGGGLPETDCGGLLLVEPENPKALEQGILEAAVLGRLNEEQRQIASRRFTLKDSADKLLSVLDL